MTDEQDEQQPPREITSRDLWDAADTLTQRHRKRLWRDDGTSETIPLPSLLEQLTEAVQQGTEQQGGHTVPGSRPPADIAAMALLIGIAREIRDGCIDWRVKRAHDNPRDLRAWVSEVIRRGDQNTWRGLHRLMRWWAGQIHGILAADQDRTWRMHGAACRVCQSTRVPTYDDEGQEAHQPAIIVHSQDGVIDRIVCDFCGSELTGPQLVEIVRDTLRQRDRASA